MSYAFIMKNILAAQKADISEQQVELHHDCANELSHLSMKWHGYDARKSEQRLSFFLLLGLLAAIFGVSIWSSPSWLMAYYWGAASALVMLAFSCLMIQERLHQRVNADKLLKKTTSRKSLTEKALLTTMAVVIGLQGVLLGENLQDAVSGLSLGALVVLQMLAQAALLRLLMRVTERIFVAHNVLQRMNRELGNREDALSDVLNHFQQSVRINATEVQMARQRLRNQKLQLYLIWIPIGALTALGFAYFGGIAMAQLTGAGFIYIGTLRINPMFHSLFWCLMLITEVLMTQGLFCLLQMRKARRALRMGWSINERIASEGLQVPGRQALRLQRIYGIAFILSALGALAIDMALNIHYFMSVLRIGLMGILVSLTPAVGVLVIALLLAKEKLQVRLYEQFGYLPSEGSRVVQDNQFKVNSAPN